MNDHDRHLVRHLAGHFGTRSFTAKQAHQATISGSGETQGLPENEEGWSESLRHMAKQELVVAEAEGWRLVETVLQAAGILNI